VLTFTIFGGGGGGATGIMVMGCAISVYEYCSAVFICSGKTRGMTSTNPTMTICTMALIPTRLARDSPSGNIAKRAGIGFVPIFFFQAAS
jgi:hypothetical protein